MQAESRLFLAKARESLASAQSDLEAGRYNSAANRAYYSAFQVAVALLFGEAIRPKGDSWDHHFVISQVSGKLIGRRKMVSARFRGTLDRLLKARLVADYRQSSVSRSDARGFVGEAREFLEEIVGKLEE